MMTRRALLAAAMQDRRPNVLLVMTDQQTWNAMSAAGNPWLSTPAMDAIARNGLRIENAYCTYPVCSPSRSSIFTGRMPHETGVRWNNESVATGIPTMGEVFRDGGYQTIYAGKWHLPRSFDGMTGFTKIAGGSALGRDMDAGVGAACSKWLSTATAQPFLMVASFMNPHDICDWIRQHPGARTHPDVAKYPPAPSNMGVDPEEPEAVRHHRIAGIDLMSKAVGIASEWRVDDFRHYLHDYYRMVEAVDREIGKVLGAVRAAGLWDRTHIVFVSDHGEGMGGHRWVQKASFNEESVRVPLIFSGAGVSRRGVDRTALGSLADVMPTLCDVAGIASPSGMTGRSLAPLLRGDALAARPVVSELRYGGPEREGRMLRTERYKYIAFNSGERREQLFDLATDPGECVNLMSRDPQTLAGHRALLRAWVRDTRDDFAG
jgi:arylsulfatase A-like enzyme